jgi:hypothetical protein
MWRVLMNTAAGARPFSEPLIGLRPGPAGSSARRPGVAHLDECGGQPPQRLPICLDDQRICLAMGVLRRIPAWQDGPAGHPGDLPHGHVMAPAQRGR